ncbi:hypothetical protein C8Q80DRAFT_1222881 [Daedaleopsis nitida]|nr:hypothetical protein C8Q80DRAFT_1222881 [Daedaleopsis nitida]
MDSLTKWVRDHEDEGYALQQNSSLLRALVATLRGRKARTYFRWIKGHDGHPRNEGADRLAGEGARKDDTDEVNCNIRASLSVSGCRLSKISQKLAYRIIRERKERRTKPRRSTSANVAKVIDGIRTCFGVELCEAQLWKSIRKRKELSRECRQFMWMVLHDGYMVGNKWMRDDMSDELRQRAVCKRCDETETMEHILFDCAAVGRGTVWELLEETWSLTKKQWTDPCWGNTLGAGCTVLLTSRGKRDTVSEALWMTLASESLYLIWKLRCERVIQNDGEELSIRAVENRWYSTMDQRLDLDRKVAALSKRKKNKRQEMVERTWEPILMGSEGQVPERAINMGVLVGIKRVRRWDPG